MRVASLDLLRFFHVYMQRFHRSTAPILPGSQTHIHRSLQLTCAALVIFCMQSAAHTHDKSSPDWGLPAAVSSLPHELHRYDQYYFDDAYRHDYGYRYDLDAREYEHDYTAHSACLNSSSKHHSATQPRSMEKSIDWCALAPFQPRYSPQIPASWRWRWRHHHYHVPSQRRISWRQWRMSW
jgi:hypothetical protein